MCASATMRKPSLVVWFHDFQSCTAIRDRIVSLARVCQRNYADRTQETHVPRFTAADGVKLGLDGRLARNVVRAVVAVAVTDIVEPFAAVVDCEGAFRPNQLSVRLEADAGRKRVANALARDHSAPSVTPKAFVELLSGPAQ